MKEIIVNIIFMTIGVILAALALECFLVPNQIIDGGIVGISIMAGYITNLNLGLFLIILNIPFFFLGYGEFGKTFILSAFYSVSLLSYLTTFASEHLHPVTNDLLLASLFGGGILGAGVGLVLKNNSCLDGTEILAMKISKKIPYSVGEIIMVINVFIFLTAGFLYGWEKAMYSMLTYLIAYRAIDLVVQGLSEENSIRIVSDKSEELGQAIIKNLNKTVTYIEAKGGYSNTKKTMIYCVVPRIELYKLKELVLSIDENAFITIENIHEVYGRRYKKKH